VYEFLELSLVSLVPSGVSLPHNLCFFVSKVLSYHAAARRGEIERLKVSRTQNLIATEFG